MNYFRHISYNPGDHKVYIITIYNIIRYNIGYSGDISFQTHGDDMVVIQVIYNVL